MVERILSDAVVKEILSMRLPCCDTYQPNSFILPDGEYLIMSEHHDAYKFMVVEGLAPSTMDAEQLLLDLGFVPYSWMGYVVLPERNLTPIQYKKLREVFENISKMRDKISVQIQVDPRFYINYDLNDIDYIINKIEDYYNYGILN